MGLTSQQRQPDRDCGREVVALIGARTISSGYGYRSHHSIPFRHPVAMTPTSKYLFASVYPTSINSELATRFLLPYVVQSCRMFQSIRVILEVCDDRTKQLTFNL